MFLINKIVTCLIALFLYIYIFQYHSPTNLARSPSCVSMKTAAVGLKGQPAFPNPLLCPLPPTHKGPARCPACGPCPLGLQTMGQTRPREGEGVHQRQGSSSLLSTGMQLTISPAGHSESLLKIQPCHVFSVSKNYEAERPNHSAGLQSSHLWSTMCSRVYVSELFIYACHLPLAHELARGKGKGSQETVELCDIFKRAVSTCTYTHFSSTWEAAGYSSKRNEFLRS